MSKPNESTAVDIYPFSDTIFACVCFFASRGRNIFFIFQTQFIVTTWLLVCVEVSDCMENWLVIALLCSWGIETKVIGSFVWLRCYIDGTSISCPLAQLVGDIFIFAAFFIVIVVILGCFPFFTSFFWPKKLTSLFYRNERYWWSYAHMCLSAALAYMKPFLDFLRLLRNAAENHFYWWNVHVCKNIPCSRMTIQYLTLVICYYINPQIYISLWFTSKCCHWNKNDWFLSFFPSHLSFHCTFFSNRHFLFKILFRIIFRQFS